MDYMVSIYDSETCCKQNYQWKHDENVWMIQFDISKSQNRMACTTTYFRISYIEIIKDFV